MLDHIAKPPIKSGALSPWSEQIREVARTPHASILRQRKERKGLGRRDALVGHHDGSGQREIQSRWLADWFPDFLRYMAQLRLNSDGELETLKPEDWLALRGRMREVRRATAGQDTPYLRIIRRFVPE